MTPLLPGSHNPVHVCLVERIQMVPDGVRNTNLSTYDSITIEK